jgi:hypothetical protein
MTETVMLGVGLLALHGLAACGDVHAEPIGAHALPAGWQELPDFARTARDALAGVTIDRLDVWGSPARGCFAAHAGLRGAAREASTVQDEVLGSLRGEPRLAGLLVHDIIIRPDGGISLAFEHAQYRGTLRVAPGHDGAGDAFVCFANDREPAGCEVACKQLAGLGEQVGKP